MRELDELFAALAKSAFRRKFHLQGKDLEYLHNKGLTTVLSHANDFISKRLAPAFPEKDGKQTPFRGAPCICCATCNGLLLSWLSVKMASNSHGACFKR